ncbi:MAG: leucine-rich repeat protein [Peptococcaceae bacterium]|jgi:hypothetical protein|nr:leucine-rich repeat protein [Peptococcaceae bacterium]
MVATLMTGTLAKTVAASPHMFVDILEMTTAVSNFQYWSGGNLINVPSSGFHMDATTTFRLTIDCSMYFGLGSELPGNLDLIKVGEASQALVPITFGGVAFSFNRDPSYSFNGSGGTAVIKHLNPDGTANNTKSITDEAGNQFAIAVSFYWYAGDEAVSGNRPIKRQLYLDFSLKPSNEGAFNWEIRDTSYFGLLLGGKSGSGTAHGLTGNLPSATQYLESFPYTPNTYSDELAQHSAVYSMLAYEDYGYSGDDFWTRKMYATPGFLKMKLYEDKFEQVEIYNYGNDTVANVAYVIAKKRVRQNNQDRTLVLVAIRGTGGSWGWVGNMDLAGEAYNPSSVIHESFNTAKNDVYNKLNKYLQDNLITDALVWTTGHSRGAAVANLLAHQLNTSANSRIKDVYAYTFATPGVAKVVESDSNIYNFMFKDDFVPRGFENWGYGVYGKTYKVTANNVYDIVSGFRDAMDRYVFLSNGKRKAEFNQTATNNVMSYVGGRWKSTSEYYNHYYLTAPFASLTLHGFFRDYVALAAMDRPSNVMAQLGVASAAAGNSVYGPVAYYFVAGSKAYINDTHQAFTYYAALKAGAFPTPTLTTASASMLGTDSMPFSLSAAAAPSNPDASEVIALKAFAAQDDNAQNLGWDLNDISTWDGVEWGDGTVNRVIGLDVSYKELTGTLDVSGFTALVNLDGNGNYLSAIIADGCAALESVSCAYNYASALSLAGCASLRVLNLDWNNLDSVDVSGFPALVALSCERNRLTSLDVSGNLALESLYCAGNELTDIDVTANTRLTAFGCQDNYLDVYEDAALVSSLAEIESRENGWVKYEPQKPIASIPVNADDLSQLSALALQGDNLSALGWNMTEPLNLRGVEWIKMGGEYRISRLTLDGLALTGTLEIAAMPYLIYLNCNDNTLANIVVSDCPELVYLSLNNSGVTGLGVENCPSLAVLNCGNNYLELQNNSALQELIMSMSENGLTVNYAGQKILADKEAFNQDEYDVLLAFAEAGDNLAELGWDVDKPGEWGGISWGLFDGEYKAVRISLAYQNVAGDLDLSGFDVLSDVDFKMSGVTSLVLPHTISIIPDGAFYDCESLARITLPDTLLYIGSDAFYNCAQMTDVVLPEGLIAIGDNAFRSCSSLVSVVIPDSVTAIGEEVFYDCLSLRRAVFRGNAPDEFGEAVFVNAADGFLLYYYAGSEGWERAEWSEWTLKALLPGRRAYDIWRAVKEDGAVKVSVANVLNHYGDAPVLIIAVYDEQGRLIALRTIGVKEELVDYSFGVDEFEDARTIKVFLWEATETLKPLSEVILIPALP